jgi:lysyl-tRNA synthetase class 1
MNLDIAKAVSSRAWPFIEAEAILKKINYKVPEKGYILLETGYGPSGLPHIGTFGEVARTTMVRYALSQISDIPTRLFCISDDMDGMRKIPENIPNPEKYKQYIGLPLTKIPDPFGSHESYGHNMNARLMAFLDSFGFDYEFISSSEYYRKGFYNEALLKVLQNYEKIMDIMLPTLGSERQATYSPFLPVCQKTGKVLQVSVSSIDKDMGTITFLDEEGEQIEQKVTDGMCKLQWKPDMGMRWAALDVDFEMYGKDHLVNGPIYTRICQAIGGKGPHQMFYELFLDESGQKISKSKGNGITIDQWLQYATKDSLSLFMYQSPQKAKKLHFEIIPKCMDEYLTYLYKYANETDEVKKLANPVYFIHNGNPPLYVAGISFSLLLNLVGACNTDDVSVIWGYVKRQVAQSDPLLEDMVRKAINYYDDYVKPFKNFRAPSEIESQAMKKLSESLRGLKGATAEEIQTVVYSIGMESGMDLKNWFSCLYQVLLGAEQGPRFGSFVHLYGVQETIDMIERSLSM